MKSKNIDKIRKELGRLVDEYNKEIDIYLAKGEGGEEELYNDLGIDLGEIERKFKECYIENAPCDRIVGEGMNCRDWFNIYWEDNLIAEIDLCEDAYGNRFLQLEFYDKP